MDPDLCLKLEFRESDVSPRKTQVNKANLWNFYPQRRFFREKSKSQNRNPISPTTKSTSGIIQVTTKACQLCSTPFVLLSTNI